MINKIFYYDTRGKGKRLTKTLIFLLIVVIFFGFDLKAKPDLKNIIIISVDTLRADHLGCYGYPLNTSPTIDTFSRDGVLFSNCYTLTPLTTPAFSTMLTSLPPYKHGAKRNGLSIYRCVLTLPYFLKRFGYRSAAFISNWPLRKKLSGLHKDFDDYYEVLTKIRRLALLANEGEALVVTQKAIKWMEKNHKKKFFLWVHYTEPHYPYKLHKKFTFRYEQIPTSIYPPGTRMKKVKKYDSEIAYTDFHIGKLIEKIKSLGLYREALIIFNSDHGESFGEHNYFRHGRRLYNSTLHVPLIVKLPDSKFKNTVRQENVSLLDISPTIFSVLNIPCYPKMEGISLFKEETASLNRAIFLETYRGPVHMRRKEKKYHLKVKPIRYGFLKGSSKVIFNVKKNTFEVYQLKDDPNESRNIFLQEHMQVKEMKQALLDKVNEISNFIKYNRAYHLQDASLTKEDLARLKSLGYID